MEQEIWLPVKDYETSYKISNYGRFIRLAGKKLNAWKQIVDRPESYPVPSAKTSDTMYLYIDGTDQGKQSKKGYKIDELLLSHFPIEQIHYKINPVITLEGELWKPVVGYSDYEISNKGRIKALSRTMNSRQGSRVSREKLINPYLNPVIGYMYVNLRLNKSAHTRSFHRLLANTWVSNPENKREVNHIDGNKLNNELSNLEWMSPIENTRHAFYTGKMDNKLKLSIEKVKEIRRIYKEENKNYHEIAKLYNVKMKTIRRVILNQTWTF